MSREHFIGKTEHDVRGKNSTAYKFLKSMNFGINDTASINTIPKNNWIEHCKSLWYDPEKEALTDIGETHLNVDLITMRKF